MQNLLLLFLIIMIVVILFSTKNEKFSDSGLAISDRYCQKLADVYYEPQVDCPECRSKFTENICGHKRRNTVTDRNGNYFFDYGVLV